MKKIIFSLILFCLVALVGCTTGEILKTIDGIYRGVKTVVTAPDVKAQITPDKLARLAEIETHYLKAADDVRATGVDNSGPLSVVVDCADEFMMVIDTLALEGKHKREIEGIGVSIKFLKKFVQRE